MDGSALPLLAALEAALTRGERAALATVVRTGGSTPQGPGARMLLLAGGKVLGTVGGGHVEAKVLAALSECVAGKPAHTLSFELGRDLGMCCGGRMEVFVEPIEGAPRLILFGAGHVAHATVRLALTLSFRVFVVDEREELNTAERFGAATRLLASPAEALRELVPTEDDFVLIATHDHALDQVALEAALAHPHRYIGVIGSQRKIHRFYDRIAMRHGAVSLARVYAPVGLAIGALGPEEIAVSIMAELIALRRGHEAPHMRVPPRVRSEEGP